MINCSTYLEETGDILDAPLSLPEGGDTVGLSFGHDKVVSMNLANWPLVTLHRSILVSVPEDLSQHYLDVLTLNADLQDSTLACDEAGELHLLQSVNATEFMPGEFADCLKRFAELGTTIPQRLDGSMAKTALSADEEEHSAIRLQASPDFYRFIP